MALSVPARALPQNFPESAAQVGSWTLVATAASRTFQHCTMRPVHNDGSPISRPHPVRRPLLRRVRAPLGVAGPPDLSDIADGRCPAVHLHRARPDHGRPDLRRRAGLLCSFTVGRADRCHGKPATFHDGTRGIRRRDGSLQGLRKGVCRSNLAGRLCTTNPTTTIHDALAVGNLISGGHGLAAGRREGHAQADLPRRVANGRRRAHRRAQGDFPHGWHAAVHLRRSILRRPRAR